MAEPTLNDFARAVASIGPGVEAKARAVATPIIQILSVSGAQAGINAGVDIDGKPFAPVKFPRPEGGTAHPLRDKGLLAASISASVTERELTLSANAPGARILNYGGTITPKKKFLTIPLTVEAKRAGGARQFPRPLFFRAVASGTAATLCEDIAGTLTVHYVLVKSVTIPARRFLGWSAATLDKIGRVMAESYENELIKALGGK